VANGVVNLIVLAGILLLLVFSCYALWDSSQVYATARASRYEKYKPTAGGGELSFQELQALNTDVFAWLTVYGTHIDYPVVQGTNNLTYVNTNAEGKHALSGAIFLDCDNAKDFSDFTSILYGHHMEKETMFGEIGLFAHQNYFEVRRYGSLYYEGREHGLEFFAFLHTSAYDGSVFRARVVGARERQAWLDKVFSEATCVRDGVAVTPDDRLVLLATCSASTTNGRDILIGRITDATYADPFAHQAETGAGPVIDRLVSLWARIPLAAKIALAGLLLCLLILLAVVLTRKKKLHTRAQSAAPTIEERL